MKLAAFNAVCPYEIGDRVRVIKAVNGQMCSVGVSTITDIACTHYIRAGKIDFTYELDGCGHYAPLQEVGKPEAVSG